MRRYCYVPDDFENTDRGNGQGGQQKCWPFLLVRLAGRTCLEVQVLYNLWEEIADDGY
jgi:hypothetical protein